MPIQPLGTAQATRKDPTRVLEEIKRLALEQLGGLPGSLYPAVERALEAAANSNMDPRASQVLYQNQAALWVLKQHHAAHVMRFRQNVGSGFDSFRPQGGRARRELPLGLVDEGQLDLHLAGQTLVQVFEKIHAEPLEAMAGRLKVLSAVLGLEPPENPVGPERLVSSFVDTLSGEQVPEALRGQLFRQYEQELAKVLGNLYEQVNTLLASSGYGTAVPGTQAPAPRPEVPPVSHHELVEPRFPSAPADATGPAGPGWSGADAAGGHGPAGGAGVGPGASGAVAPGHGNAAGDQRGASAAGAPGGGDAAAPQQPGFDSAPGASAPTPAELVELRNMLHAWREGVLRGAAGPMPAPGQVPQPVSAVRREMRVDEVVSVASLLQAEPSDVFARALAGSGRLAGVIREQLSDGSRRLGLDPEGIRFSLDEEDAIDLVALLFDSLFQSHQLQDRARRLYARLVLPIVKVALTDQDMFVRPAHPARRLIDAITEACAGNRGETSQERELLDRAAAVSQRVVAEYNEDLAIFETAHAELDALLQQQRRRIELQAERAAKATYGRERLNLARDQADTMLATRLAAPPLSHAVADFLMTSWRHHLVQVLLREGADSPRLTEAKALGDAIVAADRVAAEARGGELARRLLALEPAIVACLASSGLDHTAAEHGLAVLVKGLVYPDAPRKLYEAPTSDTSDEEEDEKGLWLAGGTDTLRFDPAVADRMRDLEVGEWLQLTDLDGETSAVKVAWASPLTSRRLLVNRRGVRVLVASAEELAVLSAAGRLQLGCEPTPFEQAMQHVRGQLDRAVGHH